MTQRSSPRKIQGSFELLCVIAAVMLAAPVASASPGLNGPVAIGPFLNGKLPPVEPTGASEWTVQETFTGININLPVHLMPYPGTDKLLSVAKEGRIFLFDNIAEATQTDTFLDLSSAAFASSDCGMTPGWCFTRSSAKWDPLTETTFM